MKAIEILFIKIDELNTKIKNVEDLDEKYKYATQIGDVVRAIEHLSKFRNENMTLYPNEYL